PDRPTFRFRVLPPGEASTYSRSVLGASSTLRSGHGRCKGCRTEIGRKLRTVSPWDGRATMAAMPRRLLWLPVGLAAAVLLAGCGGSKKYSLEKTRACLAKQQGLTVLKSTDFVASTALGGALTAKFPHNQVTISFGLDS